MSRPPPVVTASQMAADLSVFADIGTDAPTVESTPAGHVVRLIRHGEQTEIIVDNNRTLLFERFGEDEIKHASFKALLASDRFGNLRDWVSKQRAYLDQELAALGSLIDVRGFLNGGVSPANISDIDDMLSSSQEVNSTRVLLIDGPAGIGKTQFIIGLASRRVENYAARRRPLILHVQSRGRTLSYLYDLIAFSLQRLRLDATFDQVPILAKHGLVTLAIDGFDELADPDGYNLAWSQVSDLVELLRGNGALILAGRETFIGRDRVISDISSIREGQDDISVLTLQPPTKGEAIDWLRREGWDSGQLEAIEEYLEPTSLAMRPFFLKTLSDPEIAESLTETSSTSVLSILMEAMIEREIGKFGDLVERELNASERRQFLRSFSSEAARDMAENGTTAISDATLSWLVEATLPKEVSESVGRMLKSRAQVIAFLTNDDRSGYRRFFHDKFFEYFLSLSVIDLLTAGQSGKILARTLFGSSFLETFGEVISSGTPASQAELFLSESLTIVREYPPIDSTRKNVAALLIASLSIADLVGEVIIASIELDECRFSATAAAATLSNLIISQLDCRGADMTSVAFENSVVLTLIADQDTLVPESLPLPNKIQDISLGGRTLTRPDERTAWVSRHLFNPPQENDSLVPSHLRSHDAFKLLFKACRLRQYWLRRGDDLYATRILDDPWWPVVEEALSQNNLLKVELRQASGTDARFIHVRQPEDILSENRNDPDVVNMFRAISANLSN